MLKHNFVTLREESERFSREYEWYVYQNTEAGWLFIVYACMVDIVW